MDNREHQLNAVLNELMDVLEEWEEDWSDTADRDKEYELAICKNPHADGSTCSPTWDGYMYICIYSIRKEA